MKTAPHLQTKLRGKLRKLRGKPRGKLGKKLCAWVLLGAFLGPVLGLLDASPFAFFAPLSAQALPHDYDLESTSWNGLSRLKSELSSKGITLNLRSTLNFETLSTQRPLMILAPTSPLDGESLQRFLGLGGRLLLADDTGTSNGLLNQLKLRRLSELPSKEKQRYLNKNPNLPILRVQGVHPLLENVEALIANHPTWLISEAENHYPAVVYYDDQRTGFVYDLTIDKVGKLIVVADASIYINLMLELKVGDNLPFAINSLEFLCGESSPCEVDLFIGEFETVGALSPPPKEEGARGRASKRVQSFNEVLKNLDEMVPERRFLRAMSVVLAVGLAIFLLSVFPMRAPSFLSIRFRPKRDALPKSHFERNLEIFKEEGGGANFALPLSILRYEFERLFLRELFEAGKEPGVVDRYRPQCIRDAADRYCERLELNDPTSSRRAQRRITALFRQLARVPTPSQILVESELRWSEKAMFQFYHECLEILEALGVREEYEQRTRALP